MVKKNLKYSIINIFVIFIGTVYFTYNYQNAFQLFAGQGLLSTIVLLFTVVLVHIMKAGRLYLGLYGADIKLRLYMKIYCKVTSISIILPFKIGELFRMYCYGKHLADMLKGIVIIILDRFMDTIALVTMIILVGIFYGVKPTPFIYLLIIFLIFVLLVYFIFPGVYRFWNKYLLREKSSENRLRALKVLSALNLLYSEIENIVKGRGAIMYFISLIAWGGEIGSVIIAKSIKGDSDINADISKYLTAAVNGSQSPKLNQFIFASVIGLVGLYIGLKVYETVTGKGDGK